MRARGPKTKRVRIYVEGGGTHDLKSECRAGFSSFFEKVFRGRRPEVVACGGWADALHQFENELRENPDVVPILLIDAEGAVGRRTPWQHLARRRKAGWRKPQKANDDQLHLMVQLMETWFLADVTALQRFYGQGFNAGSIPAANNLESVAPAQVLSALVSATRRTKTKGEYGKSRHSFKLLAEIDPVLVQRRSPHAQRLFDSLRKLGMR